MNVMVFGSSSVDSGIEFKFFSNECMKQKTLKSTGMEKGVYKIEKRCWQAV